MYLNIYIHLPPFAINDHPFAILLNWIFVARSAAGFLFDHHDFAIATWLQWFHLSNGDQAINGEVPSNNWESTSNATAYAKTRLCLWFSLTLATKWMETVSEVHAGKTPAIFLGDVTCKNGLYWLVNWGSLCSPNCEFLPQPGVKEESAGSCSIDCPNFMFVYAPARILVGWENPHISGWHQFFQGFCQRKSGIFHQKHQAEINFWSV